MTLPAPLRDLVRTVATGRDPQPPIGQFPARLARWFLPLRPFAPVLATIVGLLLALAAAASLAPYHVGGYGTLVVAAGSGLPIVLLPDRSLMAWRFAWLLTLLSGTNHVYDPDTPWPANPVLILVYLVVLLVVGYRQPSGVLFWVWLFSVIPVVGYLNETNVAGGIMLVTLFLLLGYLLSRWSQARGRLAEEEERGAVLTERARIARELHDVVAHHMSLIAVRAETAQYRLGELPESARGEFAEISQASRAALTEMRRLLGVLRSDAERAPTTPQPGLADLPELVDAARAAGTPVTFEVHGELSNVPPAVDLSAYRVVQESLSNAARHAAGAPVELVLRRTDEELVVRVNNGFVGAPTGGGTPGHGLRGMRERVTLLGGQFSAGPTSEGDFEVHAILPLGSTG